MARPRKAFKNMSPIPPIKFPAPIRDKR